MMQHGSNNHTVERVPNSKFWRRLNIQIGLVGRSEFSQLSRAAFETGLGLKLKFKACNRISRVAVKTGLVLI